MPVIYDSIRSPAGAVVYSDSRSVAGILSVESEGQANTVVAGSPVTFQVNQLPTAQGQVELQSADGLYFAVLTVTTWDSANGVVTVTGARGELPFGTTDAVLLIEDSAGNGFDTHPGISVQAPAGTKWINGNSPSFETHSIFYEAVTPPTGNYQIIWQDPNATGAVMADTGEITSAESPGDITVAVWDETDGTTSAEVAFSVNEVFDWVNATAEFASPAGYISKAGNETFTKYLYPVVAFEGQKTTIDAWPGTLTSYYHGYLKIEGLSIRTGM